MSPETITFDGPAGKLVGDRWPAADARGTLLLLHGGGQTRHSWRRSGVRFAAEGWTTLALDARGHGDSAWAPDGDYSLDAMVADLRAVVAELEVPPVLVGASLGGITSLMAEGETPGLATALVLVDISPSPDPAGVKRILSFMRSRPEGFASLEEVADAIAAYNPHRPRPSNLDGLKKNVRLGDDGRWHWHWDPAFLALDDEPTRAERRERLVDAARNVKIPTMLVVGSQSDVVNADSERELLELIPHAVVTQAHAGHMVAGDDNDVFVAQVAQFLDDELPRPGR